MQSYTIVIEYFENLFILSHIVLYNWKTFPFPCLSKHSPTNSTCITILTFFYPNLYDSLHSSLCFMCSATHIFVCETITHCGQQLTQTILGQDAHVLLIETAECILDHILGICAL